MSVAPVGCHSLAPAYWNPLMPMPGAAKAHVSGFTFFKPKVVPARLLLAVCSCPEYRSLWKYPKWKLFTSVGLKMWVYSAPTVGLALRVDSEPEKAFGAGL